MSWSSPQAQYAAVLARKCGRSTGATGTRAGPVGAGSGTGRSPDKRRGEAGERRVRIDVPHRDRREVGLLADPGAEPCHRHGVGAEIVEEVRVGRDRGGLDHVGQQDGEAVSQRRLRVGVDGQHGISPAATT